MIVWSVVWCSYWCSSSHDRSNGCRSHWPPQPNQTFSLISGVSSSSPRCSKPSSSAALAYWANNYNIRIRIQILIFNNTQTFYTFAIHSTKILCLEWLIVNTIKKIKNNENKVFKCIYRFLLSTPHLSSMRV